MLSEVTTIEEKNIVVTYIVQDQVHSRLIDNTKAVCFIINCSSEEECPKYRTKKNEFNNNIETVFITRLGNIHQEFLFWKDSNECCVRVRYRDEACISSKYTYKKIQINGEIFLNINNSDGDGDGVQFIIEFGSESKSYPIYDDKYYKSKFGNYKP